MPPSNKSNNVDSNNGDIESASYGSPTTPKVAKVLLTSDVLFSRDQSTAMTQDNTSVNIDRTLKSERSQGSVLVRIDSSVLQMASSMNDEFDISDHNNVNDRQSDLCCFICCDLVRACVVCDVCDIILTIALVLASVFEYDGGGLFNTVNFGIFTENQMDDFVVIDDDEILELNESLKQKASIVTVMMGCGIIFSIIGIVGALKFQKYMVLVTAIWYCVDVLRSALTFQYANIVVTACFAYPHFALFHALRKSKITKQNYSKEKHCCCECCER